MKNNFINFLGFNIKYHNVIYKHLNDIYNMIWYDIYIIWSVKYLSRYHEKCALCYHR